MAVEIGALRALLSLDSAAFETGAKRARASMTGLQKTTQRAGAIVAKVGRGMAIGISAMAGAAIAGGMAASRSFKELSEQARIAGMGAEDFKILALAASEFGVEQDQLSDILKDVNDKLGDFAATGGGPLKDFFENIAPQVGLTLESFEGLSSSDALQLYVNALEQANVSQAEMTFYMEAIANDATALIPLFKDNGAAIQTMAARAKELGLSLDEGAVAAAAKARSEFGVVAEVLKTRLGAAFAELTPAIAELAEAAIPLIVSALELLKPIIQGIASLLTGDFAGAWASAKEAGSLAINGILALAETLLPRIGEALSGLGTAIVEALKQAAVDAVEEAKRIGRQIIAGLSFGIQSNAGMAGRSARKAVRDGIDGAKAEADIQSPSREFMRIGQQMMQGLSLGIGGSAAAVAEEAAESARVLMQGVDEAIGEGATVAANQFDQIGDSLASALIEGENMAASLVGIFQQLAQDLLATGITEVISMIFGGGAGSAGGLGGAVAAIFGGARADGGPVSSGKAYLVGERGPKIFAPGASGQIIPNHAMNGSGGNVVQLQTQIVNNAGVSIREEQQDLGGGRRLQRFVIGEAVNEAMTAPGTAASRTLNRRGVRQPLVRR